MVFFKLRIFWLWLYLQPMLSRLPSKLYAYTILQSSYPWPSWVAHKITPGWDYSRTEVWSNQDCGIMWFGSSGSDCITWFTQIQFLNPNIPFSNYISVSQSLCSLQPLLLLQIKTLITALLFPTSTWSSTFLLFFHCSLPKTFSFTLHICFVLDQGVILPLFCF